MRAILWFTSIYMHIHISWWKAFYDIYLHFEKNFWCYITIYIRTHIFWHFHDTYLYTYIHFARHFHDMYPHVCILFERYSFYATYSHLEWYFYDSHIYAFCKAFSWFHLYTFCKAFFATYPCEKFNGFLIQWDSLCKSHGWSCLLYT